MKTRPSRRKQCEEPCVGATPKAGCKECRRRVSEEIFIRRATELFGDTYDYSTIKYVSAKTHIDIICRLHGKFSQTPDKHVQSKYPCPECFLPIKSEIGRNNIKTGMGGRPSGFKSSNTYTVERFLDSLGPVDEDKFSLDLSDFGGLTIGSVTINCVVHGNSVFSPPRNLILSKHKCQTCAREMAAKSLTKSWSDFLEDADRIHQSTYSYVEPENFNNRKSKIEIKCPTHGSFYKTAQKHLAGQGCFPCNVDRLVESGSLVGGYNENLFKSDPEIASSPCIAYYLKVGDLYKIGITRQKLGKRVNQIRSDSKKDVTILKSLECTLEEGYALEQNLLRDHSDLRVYRNWSTELFSEDVLGDLDLTTCTDVARLN